MKIKIPSLKTRRLAKKVADKGALFLSFGKSKGSMALEGSLVLPIFLFFMMTVLLSLEAVRFQSDVQEALHQAGNRNAFEAYQEKKGQGERANAQNQIKEYLSSQVYPYLCVAGGEGGVYVRDLSSIEGSGNIELFAEYGLKPFIGWLPIGEIKMKDRFFSHAWIGYQGGAGQSSKAEETYVYITKTGSRYHLSYHCAYLGPQVQAADYSQISSLRNGSGGKYYACRRCKPAKGGTVYITEDGTSYHGRSDCSSLKRTVYMVPLSKVEGYGACSKCGG